MQMEPLLVTAQVNMLEEIAASALQALFKIIITPTTVFDLTTLTVLHLHVEQEIAVPSLQFSRLQSLCQFRMGCVLYRILARATVNVPTRIPVPVQIHAPVQIPALAHRTDAQGVLLRTDALDVPHRTDALDVPHTTDARDVQFPLGHLHNLHAQDLLSAQLHHVVAHRIHVQEVDVDVTVQEMEVDVLLLIVQQFRHVQVFRHVQLFRHVQKFRRVQYLRRVLPKQYAQILVHLAMTQELAPILALINVLLVHQFRHAQNVQSVQTVLSKEGQVLLMVQILANLVQTHVRSVLTLNVQDVHNVHHVHQVLSQSNIVCVTREEQLPWLDQCAFVRLM